MQRAYCRSDLFGTFIFAGAARKTLLGRRLSFEGRCAHEVRDALADTIVGGDERACARMASSTAAERHAQVGEVVREERIRKS